MRFFLSYARKNRPEAESLARRIQQLGHESWLDGALTGGQAWWDEILAQIRACDALVFVLSDESLESEACTEERRYASALGKRVLPVGVDSVPTATLPPDVAGIQVIDYTKPGEDAAIELAKAISRVTPAPPPPEPLPDPPPVPTSYLTDLGHRVAAATLTRDEQLGLVADIEQALRRARNRENREDYDAALAMLTRLDEHPDLLHVTGQQIRAVRENVRWDGPPPEAPKREIERRAAMPPEKPAKARRSKIVTILAAIGAIFAALVLIGALQACEQTCGYDIYGNYVCQ